ncbi:unnamed protein product, partial [Sphenostylis stenocarpa]
MSHPKKGKKVTERKKPRYILKINVPPPPIAPTPIPSSSVGAENIHAHTNNIAPTTTSAPSPVDAPNPSPSPVIASAPSPGATLPSVLSVPSRVHHTLAREDQEVHIQEGDAQSDIEEDHPLGTNLPIISPYGLG